MRQPVARAWGCSTTAWPVPAGEKARMTSTETAPSTGTTPRTGAPSLVAPPAGLPPALGGTRGLVDGGLPPLVLVAVNAVVAAQTTRPAALVAAIGAATATGLGIVALRLLRKEPLRQAFGGLAGLAIAVASPPPPVGPAGSSWPASSSTPPMGPSSAAPP